MEGIQFTENGLVAPIDLIVIDKGFNIRKKVEPSKELIDSIKEVGIIDPIHVREKEGSDKLHVVNGERRAMAAKKLGLEFVPIVNNGIIDDTDALVIAMTSKNDAPYTDQETASGIKRLNDSGVDLKQMSAILGISSRSVSEYYKLVTQGSKVLREADIPVRVASRIAEFPEERHQELLDLVSGKSREEALDLIRKAEKEMGTTKPGKKKEDIDNLQYPLVKKPRVVLEEFEKVLLKKIKADKKSERLRGMRDAVDIMKGAKSIQDILG